jgi:hypothetical protein
MASISGAIFFDIRGRSELGLQIYELLNYLLNIIIIIR